MGRFIEEMKKILPTVNITCFGEFDELLNADYLMNYDCVFIATEINCHSGVEVAMNIHLREPSIEMVFITENCEKYSQRIFDYADKFRPFALLCKPVSRIRLRHIVEMLNCVSERKKCKDIVIRQVNKDFISLNASDIMYIQHNSRISYIYTKDGSCYSTRYGISWFDDKLPACFAHCAKSCIVNILKVESINGSEIKLSDGCTVWCSRQYKSLFLESVEQCHGSDSSDNDFVDISLGMPKKN